MNRLGIVIKEVYRKNVFSWSFFWMIFSPIIMIGVVLLIGYFIASDQASSTIGNIAVVNADSEIQTVIDEANQGNQITYTLSLEEARNQLAKDEIDGFLLVDSNNINESKYYRKATSKDISLSQIEAGIISYILYQQASQLGLNESELNNLLATQMSIESINISVSEEGDVTETSTQDPRVLARTAVAYAVCIIVFIFIMNYVGIISQEIAAEKGSRIMEIILSSVSASTHFIGKLLGILLVILTQLAIYFVLYLLFMLVVRQFNLLTNLMDFDLSFYLAGTRNVILTGILYALIGIAIYSSLAGFLGSLVSRTEDVNKMITPIIFTALGGFYIGMYALASPNSPIVRIGSQIPLFTPFIMPFRIASETVSNLELSISIVISIIFMVIVVAFSLVFYKSNVLVYSDKGMINTFKRSFALWKSERATK